MKIGIVTEYHYPTIGGIQDHIHFFHRELLRLRYEAVVLTPRVLDETFPPGEEITDPGRVIRIGISRPFYSNGSRSRVSSGWGLVGEFEDVLQSERFDLLHVHTPFAPTLPLLTLKFAQVPVVGTFHTNVGRGAVGLAKVFLPLIRRYVERLDARIAVSETCARSMQTTLGGSYTIIPNGVDIETFASGEPVAAYADDAWNLLFVGRLDPRNGLDEVIQAAALVARAWPVRLLVLGDGPLREHYETIARRALGERVVFLGTRVASRPAWYATADVLCCPIRIASFGLVLLEAMAAGLPIVANCIAGFTDVMQHGRQGLFVDTTNPRAFAEAIVEVCQNEFLRRRLAKNGRETAERYAWPKVTAHIVGLYESLVRRPRLRVVGGSAPE